MHNELITPTLTNSSIRIGGGKNTGDPITYDWHFHEEFEILWVLSKNKKYFVNEKECSLSEGDIVFVNERIPHKTETPNGGESFLLQFTANVFGDDPVKRSLLHFVNHTNRDFVVCKAGTPANAAIGKCLEIIREENSARRKSYGAFIKASVYELLAVLYRYDILCDPESFFVTEKIQRLLPVFDYVNECYAEPISLADVSKLLNVDRSHFCRMFKNAVKVTFVDYLYFVRLSAAEKLLTSTDKTIAEIAYETGFSSASYFAMLFRRTKGTTPGHYQKARRTIE